jgi:hypothetical protein
LELNENYRSTGTKKVELGDKFGFFTALVDGSAMRKIAVLCECGRFEKHTAAMLASGVKVMCAACEDAIAAWQHPKVWKNPRPLTSQEIEIRDAAKAREAERNAKRSNTSSGQT